MREASWLSLQHQWRMLGNTPAWWMSCWTARATQQLAASSWWLKVVRFTNTYIWMYNSSCLNLKGVFMVLHLFICLFSSEPPDSFSKLQVLYPQEDVVTVEVGKKQESEGLLCCHQLCLKNLWNQTGPQIINITHLDTLLSATKCT